MKKQFTKTIIAPLLFLLGLEMGCATVSKPYESLDVVVEQVEQVVQVSDETNKTYDISQKAAEIQLAQLAKTANREDAWIYIVRNGEGVLIDVGGKYNDPHSVEVDIDKIKKILKPKDEITVYHIHPESYARKMFTEEELKNMLGKSRYDNLVKRETINFMPSVEDIVMQGALKQELQKNKVLVHPAKVFGNNYFYAEYDVDVTQVKKNKDMNGECYMYDDIIKKQNTTKEALFAKIIKQKGMALYIGNLFFKIER